MNKRENLAAAELLAAVLEALPPERPRDLAVARHVVGAVMALRLSAGVGALPEDAGNQ